MKEAILAVLLAAMALTAASIGATRAETVRRQRIVSHGCQDRAWCWQYVRKEAR